MKFDKNRIVSTIRSVIGDNGKMIPLHEPEFDGNERVYVNDCLDSTFVSSVGQYVTKFERLLSDYTGAGHVVAVANGTVALQICLELAGVTRGDEVILPALTFVGTANAVVHAGAVPHFVDSDQKTLGLSPEALIEHLEDIAEIRDRKSYNRLTGSRIFAVVPMHTFGQPVDMDRLQVVAEQFHLVIIEDAAESLGSFYKGKHTGRIGLLSSLSFNGNKVITTGAGGAILTEDADLAHQARHLTTTARVAHQWAFLHDEVGYNFRMANLNAALGCAQMENLQKKVDAKRRLAAQYADAFAPIDGVTFYREQNFSQSNYWLNTLILDAASIAERDELLSATNSVGIMSRPVWTLLHRLPMYQTCPRGNLRHAEFLEQRIINIPSSANLVAHE